MSESVIQIEDPVPVEAPLIDIVVVAEVAGGVAGPSGGRFIDAIGYPVLDPVTLPADTVKDPLIKFHKLPSELGLIEDPLKVSINFFLVLEELTPNIPIAILYR